MRPLLPGGAARHRHRGYGGGVSSAKEGGEDDSTVLLGDFLQHVAAVGDGADGDDDQPGLERVDVKAGEFPVREGGKNHGREQQELREGENFLRCGAVGEGFEAFLEFKQQEAGDAQSGCDPEVIVVDERADQVRSEAGHF
jgi:hypothetical protein